MQRTHDGCREADRIRSKLAGSRSSQAIYAVEVNASGETLTLVAPVIAARRALEVMA
jgi:hypothetical protein